MKKIDKIKELFKRVFLNNIGYSSDYTLILKFIQERKFEDLQLLLSSIIEKEKKKAREIRITNFEMLITAQDLLGEYIEQLEYIPESSNE